MSTSTPRPANQMIVVTATDERKTYEGSCHCKSVKFTVILPPIETICAYECNCSICHKTGVLNFYPYWDDLKIQSGEEKLKEYRFGGKNLGHRFCSECSTNMFIDLRQSTFEPLRPFVAVNARTLEGVELETLHKKKFDGKNAF
ncbi:hypothetical protein BT69DRAFT_1285048 [Atractiella rhizophila]|nr:hypothetical protein BT69DRAFT_1285048 [Atractiella rhizophila]